MGKFKTGHCIANTKEEIIALEEEFTMEFLQKHETAPTFADAIKWALQKQRESDEWETLNLMIKSADNIRKKDMKLLKLATNIMDEAQKNGGCVSTVRVQFFKKKLKNINMDEL